MAAEFRLFLPDDVGGILGSMDETGVLTFFISARPGSPLRGTELFEIMLRAFGGRVRAVQGVWRRGFEGSPSVNLDRVNERTAASVSLMDAVRQTWTYTRAARWGFTRITLTQVEGTPGNYDKIDVLLEKGEEHP
jgi:hypothetical protein